VRPETVKFTAKKKKQEQPLKRQTSPKSGKIPFANVPLSSRVINQLIHVSGLKRSPTGGRRGNRSAIGLSAGLPGNEDVDPPKRRSRSPADRWYELNRNLKD
jgi:hypothetical protein